MASRCSNLKCKNGLRISDRARRGVRRPPVLCIVAEGGVTQTKPVGTLQSSCFPRIWYVILLVRRLTVPVCPSTGGHTSEALTMVSALDFSRYQPRTYIVSEGDTLSAQKAHDLERSKSTTASLSVCAHPNVHLGISVHAWVG